MTSRKTAVAALASLPFALRFWRFTLVLLLIAVSFLALAPAPSGQWSAGSDKLNHVLAFAALAASGSLGFPDARGRLVLALLGFGVLIELLQSFTPSRMAGAGDLLADAMGVAIGLGMAGVAGRCASWLGRAG